MIANRKEKSQTNRFSKKSVLTVATITLLLLLAEILLNVVRISRLRHEKAVELNAISDLKIKQLVQWQKERLSEAEFFSSNSQVTDNIALIFGEKDSTGIINLTQIFTPFLNEWRYENVGIFTITDSLIFSLKNDRSLLDPELRKRIKTVREEGKVTVFGFYFLKSQDKVHFDIASPLHSIDGEITGVILFRTNPETYLFPLVEGWPTTTKTSEIVLVQEKNDSVIYINRVRESGSGPLKYKISVNREKVPAVRAVKGDTGIFDGYDYSGHRVFAWLSAVPGTPWFMVAKIDKTELFAEVYLDTLLLALIIILITALSGVLFSLASKNRERKLYQSLYETEEKHKLSLIEKSRLISESDKEKNDLLQKLNNAQETAKIGSWEWDIVTGKVWWSDELYRIFDEKKDEYAPSVESNASFVHPADNKPYHEEVRRILSQHEILDYDIRIITRKGILKHCNSKGQPFYDENGNPVRMIGTFMDITDRKIAEEEIRESEAKFRAFFENSLDAIMLTAPEGGILSANQAACDLFGYSEEELMKLGREGLVDLTDPRLPMLLEERSQKGKAKGELNFIRKDGTVFPAELTSGVFYDSQGRKKTSMIIRDATQRKANEQAVIQSEEKFNKAFQNSPDAITLTRATDGTILEINQSFERLSGYSRDEVLNQSSLLMDLWADPEDRIRYLNILKEKKRVLDFETRFRTKSGEIRDFFVSGEIFNLNNEPHILGVLRDITELKKNREEIFILNSMLNELIEAIKKLSAAKDMTGIIQVIKTSARKLVNSDGVTFVIKDGDYCFYADEDAISPLWKGKRFPLSSCISGLAMTSGQNIIIEDIDLDDRVPHDVYKDTFVRSILMVPMKGDSSIGAIGNYWATRHFPTPIEAELLESLSDAAAIAIENVKLYNELEARVTDRTSKLQAANQELEAFSYSVSHDLRAPLRGIDGFSKILLEDYSENLDDEGKRICTIIRDNTQKMGRLIDDLLAFSRIGRKELQKSLVDMNLLVRAVFEEVAGPEGNNKVLFDPGELLPVWGDHNMLYQVWANLLSNALKFSSGKPDPTISISCKGSEHEITFSVKDNGAGFDMNYSSKLFGVFQRLHSTKEFDGTGVGLAIVQRIIQRHGGKVWAEGKVNEGAAFYFSLPKEEYPR